MFDREHITKLEYTGRTGRDQITVECKVTGAEYIIEADVKDLEQWRDGELIQSVLPYLEPWQRELLISGVGPDAWDKIF